MGALDKLSKRMEDDAKGSKKAPVKTAAPVKPAPKKSTVAAKPAPKPVIKEPVKAAPAEEKIPSAAPAETAEAKKMGRPSVRGEKNKDYKMVNLAVPISMYDELKALGGGNVTYFINTLLKEALEERRSR